MNDPNLPYVGERYRTGNYGEDDYGNQETFVCPMCGCDSVTVYFNEHTNEIVGCEEFVKVQDFTEWEHERDET